MACVNSIDNLKLERSEMIDDAVFMQFETKLSKNHEEPSVLELKVTLQPARHPQEVESHCVASLEGFLLQPGYLPDGDDEWCFAVFDMRSGHAAEAFEVLAHHAMLIEEALGPDTSLDQCDAVLHLEKIWVDPEFRGQGLALRLMREAQHVLGRPGLLVLLKAHPDGDTVSVADWLKLASYYQSDPQLNLSAISEKLVPGWLVSCWDVSVAHARDQRFFQQNRPKGRH
jgi:GNAT superfamily N-acetyltransferase